MEVHLTPDLQAKLDQLAGATGRPQGEFVLEAVAGYFDQMEQVRQTLDRRYDELRNGSVQLLDGETAFAQLRAKGEARRSQRL